MSFEALSVLIDSGGLLALALVVWHEMKIVQGQASRLLEIVATLEERSRDAEKRS